MNHGPLLFLGAFFALCLSWYGMIAGPLLQIGRQQPEANAITGAIYPTHRAGLARQGAEIYRANGCYYCHSLNVRQGIGNDVERGWGQRMTVAQDYLYEKPVMLGSVRLGPDLTNVGVRQTNEMWHLVHLYNPQQTTPRSTMPSYPYLFEVRPIQGTPSPDALVITGPKAPPQGFEVVPKAEAKALAAYLQSLNMSQPLFEAPVPQPEKPETKTNEPAASAALFDSSGAAKLAKQ